MGFRLFLLFLSFFFILIVAATNYQSVDVNLITSTKTMPLFVFFLLSSGFGFIFAFILLGVISANRKIKQRLKENSRQLEMLKENSQVNENHTETSKSSPT